MTDKMRNIKFVKENESLQYSPPPLSDSYYQICGIKNRDTNMYETRKIVFNENNDILKIYEREYSGKYLKRFIKNANQNKYKIYPTDSIKNLDVPSKNDMMLVNSDLLN
jgi:hypothetical protein